MKKLNLGKSYGVSGINLTGGCSNSRIAFDHLGRPLKGDLSGNNTAYEDDNLIQSRCNILLSGSDGNITIAVEPETGYSCILDSSSNCI